MRDPWTAPEVIPPKPDWHPDALCLEIGQTMFFADKGEKHLLQTAKKVCGMCTVRDACLEEAMDQDERWGIFGGLGPRQRRKLATERRREAS